MSTSRRRVRAASARRAPFAIAALTALAAFFAPHPAHAEDTAVTGPVAPAVAPPPAPLHPDLAAIAAQPDLDSRTRLEVQILAGVNDARAQHGLPPLILDDRLVAAAREHAVDMAYRNHCRHTGTDGTSVRARLRRNGYPYNNWAGENILCARQTADAALGWWLASAPHRRNILHGNFTHIGVGVSMYGAYGPDMALVFAAGDANTAEPGVYRAFREGATAAWIGGTREPDRGRQ